MRPFVFSSELQFTGVQLIEASAGTGKTWNISALYIRALIEKKLNIDNILVVTFTKAATAELKGRIRSRLFEVIRAIENGHFEPQAARLSDPFLEGLRRWIEDQGLDLGTCLLELKLALKSFDRAAILTLHGFCQRAWMELPFVSGAPFEVTVLESDDELLVEKVADFWRVRFAKPDAAALERVLAAQGLTPDKLLRIVKAHFSQPLAKTFWPAEHRGPSGEDLAPLFSELSETWTRENMRWLDELLQLVELKAIDRRTFNQDTFQASITSWRALMAMQDPRVSLAALPKLDLLSTPKLHLTEKGKGLGVSLPESAFFDLAGRYLKCREALEVEEKSTVRLFLKEALAQIAPAIRAEKKARRVLSFDDLLVEVYEALKPPKGEALAALLRTRYPLALVDEFQDTDPIQLAILKALYGAPEQCLFMVGDPKQAIYSFRQADLPTYLRATRWADRTWRLTENQRSSEALIRVCNTLFSRHPHPFQVDNLDYVDVQKGQRPTPQLVGPGAACHVWLLPRSASGEYLNREEARRVVARRVAEEVVSLLALGQAGTLCFGDRGVEARDIAILVSSHREGRAMRQALARRGVRAVERSKRSVFESDEAEEWRVVLSAVAEPKSVGKVLTALSTQLFGGTVSRIEALRSSQAQLEEAMTHFEVAHQNWTRWGFAEAIHRLLDVWGGLSARLFGSGGERRVTNHRHLLEYLEARSVLYPHPSALLRHYEEAILNVRGEEGIEERLESDEGLIQILTVHAAKGLEFPIVICPDLWTALGNSKTGEKLSGLGYLYHDDGGDICFDYRLEKEIEARAKAEDAETHAAERLRLIYVALTRAVSRIYLVGGGFVSGAHKSLTSAENAPLQRLIAAEQSHGSFEAPWYSLRDSLSDTDVKVDSLVFAEPLDFVPMTSEPKTYAFLSPPLKIPPKRSLESFSSLFRQEENRRIDTSTWHDSARDHDVLSLDPLAHDESAEDGLPAGSRIGSFIHGVLERIDFNDPQGWRSHIEKSRREWGLPEDLGHSSGNVDEALTNLTSLMDRVLSTPLHSGAVLKNIPPPDLHRECEFYFSVPKLNARQLNPCLMAAGFISKPLKLEGFRGHLKGFVDLIFKAGDRWYVADWKTNFLGRGYPHYSPERLDHEVEHHGYGLQAALYLIFLHRLLRRRLPGYRPELHLGGAEYLFLRGMNPESSSSSSSTGIWSRTVTAEQIEALDAAFAEGER